MRTQAFFLFAGTKNGTRNGTIVLNCDPFLKNSDWLMEFNFFGTGSGTEQK
jgi:hypothetical protein